jgi:hypothetical protein
MYKFELGDHVEMDFSDEQGAVIARSESLHNENQYLVRYKAADGCQRESWIGESGIVSAAPKASA